MANFISFLAINNEINSLMHPAGLPSINDETDRSDSEATDADCNLVIGLVISTGLVQISTQWY